MATVTRHSISHIETILISVAIASSTGCGASQMSATDDGASSQVATERTIVTDAIGERVVEPGESIFLEMSQDSLSTGLLVCSASSSYPSSFRTYLGSGWTSLNCRKGPCQDSGVVRTYGTGTQINVTREGHGQSICRSRIDGRASDIWYKTGSDCWIWSGGTQDARWNKGC